jgi:hypothetical protein
MFTKLSLLKYWEERKPKTYQKVGGTFVDENTCMRKRES